MRKFIPIGPRALVRRAEAKKMTDGGLHIPDGATEAPWEGEVIEVGDEMRKAKVGQVVTFSRYAGNVIKVNNENFWLIHEDELFGRYEE